MKTAFSLAALASLGSAFKSEEVSLEKQAFMQYVTEWGKSYGTKEEFAFRFEEFKKTNDFILAHNTAGNTSTVGHNHLSDYTKDERKKMLGYKTEGVPPTNKVPKILDETNLLSSVDWRDRGAVTPVKNQGQCGSCWAFSTTGSIEGAYFISTNYLLYFSEQQLVDCATWSKWYCKGCEGGLMDYGFIYAESNSLMMESAYPYTAKDGKTCKYDGTKGFGKVASYEDVSPTAAQLRAALNKQPVSIAIEADDNVFQQYKTGVITADCGNQLDHGVLAVGYGTEDGHDYFLVKNSWGAAWGDSGYVKIGSDQCGVTMKPSYPTY